MKITIEFGDISKYPEDSSQLTFHKTWSIVGDVPLTPRIVWLMNAIQELTKEYKRRSDAATKDKSNAQETNSPS